MHKVDRHTVPNAPVQGVRIAAPCGYLTIHQALAKHASVYRFAHANLPTYDEDHASENL
jgi:hypothetical protein